MPGPSLHAIGARLHWRRSKMLSDATINNTIRWGGHSQNDFVPSHNALTMFDVFVWRKSYLSLFEFTGTHTIEILPDESRLLRLGARLRPLPDSEYPYPFWHSANKWHSYQQTTEVGLLFRGGKLRPLIETRTWKRAPRRPTAPGRAFGRPMTKASSILEPRFLVTCSRQATLSWSLFNGPIKHWLTKRGNMGALRAIHGKPDKHESSADLQSAEPGPIRPAQIVYQILNNQMPPGQGIADEPSRQRLLNLARSFEKQRQSAGL